MSAPPASSRGQAASRTLSAGVRRVSGAEPDARRSSVVKAALITGILGVLLLLPVGAALQIVLTGQVDDRTQTQAIVVMEPGRYWGNARPVLRSRLEHAATLYRAGVAPVVIVTGPQRRADVERGVLEANGVPSSDIVSFDTGTDTVGTLRIISGVLRDLDWSSATIITDPANAARAGATAEALGIDAHLSPTREGPGAALTSEYVGREVAALLRHHLLTRWSLQPVVPAV